MPLKVRMTCKVGRSARRCLRSLSTISPVVRLLLRDAIQTGSFTTVEGLGALHTSPMDAVNGLYQESLYIGARSSERARMRIELFLAKVKPRCHYPARCLNLTTLVLLLYELRLKLT